MISPAPFCTEWTARDAFSPSGRRNVLHLYRKKRPGQTRGVPYLSGIIEIVKQLGEYTQAEVDAAVNAAFYTVFVTTPDGSGLSQTERDEAKAAQDPAEPGLLGLRGRSVDADRCGVGSTL